MTLSTQNCSSDEGLHRSESLLAGPACARSRFLSGFVLLSASTFLGAAENSENSPSDIDSPRLCESSVQMVEGSDDQPGAQDDSCIAVSELSASAENPKNKSEDQTADSEALIQASQEVAENTQNAASLRRLLGNRRLLFFGRLEGDYANYGIDTMSTENGFELRRFRLGLAGVNPRIENISFKMEIDLADGSSSLSSFYLHFDHIFQGSLTLGNQDVTQNLSANTGSLSQLFMEAPLPVTSFSLSKRLAVSYDQFRNRSGFHAMVFGMDPNSKLESQGVAARAYFNPLRSKDGIWHLGGSYVWEKNDGPGQYRSRPESHVTDTRLLDTGSFEDVDTQSQYSMEVAGAAGAMTVRVEVFRAQWNRDNGLSNHFVGAYLEGGIFLTGQRFNYRQGKFVRPQLGEHETAWELGFRLSRTNLNDKGVSGGEQRNIGMALNYYPRANTRAQFNLIYVGSDTPGGDGMIAQMRIQYHW